MRILFLSIAAYLAAFSLSAAGLEYDRLTIPVQGEWTRTDQQGYALFTRQGKAGGFLIIRSMQGNGDILEPFLTRLMEAHAQGRTLTRATPEKIARGKTQSGLPFAGQVRFTKSDKDTWFCQYFAFDLGGAVQAVVVFSETPEAFKELSAIAAPALEQTRARPASVVPQAQLPGQATGPTSTFQQTGIMPDQFVSGVVSAQSAELKPIPFRITGGMYMDTDDLVLSARDETGAMYMVRNTVGSMASREQASEIHKIQDFGKPQKTGLSREFLMKAVQELSKQKVDMFFVNVSPVHQLSVDKKGNLFMGQSIDNHNAFLLRSSAGITLIASPAQLKKVANGWQTGGDASRIRPTGKGNAWLFVQGPEPNGKNYGTVAYALLKTDQGFQSKQIVPSFRGKPYDRAASYSLFQNVTVDPQENLVFYNNGSFWRIRPDGDVSEILKLTLPSENVSVTGPVILENGDMWLAFSTQYHVSSYANVTNGAVDVRNTWFMVGDRSRLVRIRMKNGKVELGEISSERILDALRKASIVRSDSGVMKTVLLRIDYKTGGLILADSHHSILYGLTAD